MTRTTCQFERGVLLIQIYKLNNSKMCEDLKCGVSLRGVFVWRVVFFFFFFITVFYFYFILNIQVSHHLQIAKLIKAGGVWTA